MLPGPGSHVDHVVRGPDRLLVVLDDQHRVPHVPQTDQGGQEAPVVPLVQSDGRLVENVEDAHQRRADLRGQPDPLPLAAGKGRGRPGQREVGEPHVHEEGEARPDLLQDARRDLLFPRLERQVAEEGERLPHRQAGHAVDPLSPDGDAQRLFLQPRPPARPARPVVHVPGEFFPHILGVGLPEPPLEVVHHPLERLGEGELPVPLLECEPDRLPGGSEEDETADTLRKLSERRVEGEPVVGREGGERLAVEDLGAAAPGVDRPLPDRLPGVGDHQVGVEVDRRPEPVALGARAVGAVEGEQARGDLGEAHAAVGAGELLAADRAVPLPVHHAHQPLGQLEAQRHGVGEPAARSFRDLQPVHDDVDVVFPLLVERDRLRGIPRLPVHHHAGKTVAGQLRELLAVLPLASPDDRRPQLDPRAVPHRHHGVDDLCHRLPADLLPAGGAVDPSDRGEQQPQVVVDLRDRPDGGAGILPDRLLLDRDGGGEPLDHVDVGLLHLLEELAGVGGERLHVPPLPLGVDRVEGERRFSGARDPGDHHEPVAGDLDVDVFQVVRTGAAHDDPVQGHGQTEAIAAAIRTAASRLAGLAVPFPAMS